MHAIQQRQLVLPFGSAACAWLQASRWLNIVVVMATPPQLHPTWCISLSCTRPAALNLAAFADEPPLALGQWLESKGLVSWAPRGGLKIGPSNGIGGGAGGSSGGRCMCEDEGQLGCTGCWGQGSQDHRCMAADQGRANACQGALHVFGISQPHFMS